MTRMECVVGSVVFTQGVELMSAEVRCCVVTVQLCSYMGRAEGNSVNDNLARN